MRVLLGGEAGEAQQRGSLTVLPQGLAATIAAAAGAARELVSRLASYGCWPPQRAEAGLHTALHIAPTASRLDWLLGSAGLQGA